jgi:hypothetical protein
MLFIITSIFFDIYGGQAQKLELRNLEISVKKKEILRIISRIFIVNKILLGREVIMVLSMIYSGIGTIITG